MSASSGAVPARPRVVRTLLLSSRPLSWVNTAYPFGAAYVVATGRLDLSFWIGTVFFLVPYNLAMYGINDVFDYESDMRNPRKGGVEGAVLDPRLHRLTLWSAVLLCIPFVLYLALVGTVASNLTLAVSLFAVGAYSWRGLRFKEVPFLDSLTSSVHFVSPAVFALMLAGTAWTVPLILVMLAYLLWGIASHAFGAVQDIIADRAGGLQSIATVLGAARTARFAIGGYTLSIAALLLAAALSGQHAVLLAIAAVLVVPYLAMVWPFRSLPDAECEQANRGWRRFLAINFVVGFGVTMLLIVSVL